MFLVSRFPYPLEKGDKLRAFHQLKELSTHYNVTLIALTDRTVPQKDIKVVQQYCKDLHLYKISGWQIFFGLFRSLLNGNPFQVGYFYHPGIAKKIKKVIEDRNFHHIYCQLIRTTEYVKKFHLHTKTLDYMDALGYGMVKRSEIQPVYKRWIYRSEAKRLLAYEQHIFDYFDLHTIISDQDKKRIRHPETEKIKVIPNGIDSSFFETTERKEVYDLVFVGNMSYAPNINAVEFLANEILPELPGIQLLIAGASPDPRVKKLASENIIISGWVDDIRTSYTSAKIFVAPMRIGTGLQNKLLEAMALGTPCITTTIVNNALHANNGEELIISNSKDEIIKAIHTLLKNNELRERIAQNARTFVKTNYNWKNSVNELSQQINSLIK